jgi:hypothetical protein
LLVCQTHRQSASLSEGICVLAENWRFHGSAKRTLVWLQTNLERRRFLSPSPPESLLKDAMQYTTTKWDEH